MTPQPPSSAFTTLPREASLASVNFWLGCQLNTVWQQWVNAFSVQPAGGFKLIACGYKLPPTWQMDSYLTYQFPLNKAILEEFNVAETTMELRLSSGFQQACLKDWLGQNPSITSKKQTPATNPKATAPTSLERFILNTFVQQCFEALQQQWCEPALIYQQQQAENGKMNALGNLEETLVHFAWVYSPVEASTLSDDAQNNGEYTPMALDEMPVSLPKVILSIPQYYLPTHSHAIHCFQPTVGQSTITETVAYLAAQGIPARSTATLCAGSTQLSTADLKALEYDDLIVLEDSHFQQLFLKHPALEVYMPFPISGITQWPFQIPTPIPVLPTTAPPSERVHPAMMMSSPSHLSHNQQANHPHLSPPAGSAEWHNLPQHAQQSLWDSLKVDVHAEFAPAKIPVGHLKQMSEGLIVEVADLLKNQVQLVVNGSVLAHGQLVIVGDKFGVLLTKVVGKESPSLPALGDGVPDQLAVHSAMQQDSGELGHHELVSEEQYAQPQQPVNPYEGIDPNLVQAALQMGIDPFLAQTALQLGMDLQQVLEAAQQQGMEPNQFLTLVFQQQGIEVPTPQQRQQQSQFQGGNAGMMNRQQQEGEAPEEYVQEVSRANEMLSEVDSLLNEEFEDEEYEEEEDE